MSLGTSRDSLGQRTGILIRLWPNRSPSCERRSLVRTTTAGALGSSKSATSLAFSLFIASLPLQAPMPIALIISPAELATEISTHWLPTLGQRPLYVRE